MKAGRIETYVHSDNATENKGAVIVRILTDSDFAARTDEFKAFAKQVAMLTYGALGHTRMFFAGSDMWNTISAKFPDLEEQRKSLEHSLRESIRVTEIAIMRL